MLILGVITGLVLGAVATLLGLLAAANKPARRHPLLAAFFSRLGNAPTGPMNAPTSKVYGEELDELKRDNPDLANMIAAPAVAAVEDQPAEIRPSQIEDLQQANNDKAAVTIARRYVKDPEVAIVVAALSRWHPRNEPSSEAEFQDRFITRLRGLGVLKGEVLVNERLLWSADERHGGGNRAAYPDLIVRNRVLVELKGDLIDAGTTDRAMGQMLRYLQAWKNRGPAVLAVCGQSKPEMRFLVRLYVRIWRDTLGLPVTVLFKNSDERMSHEPAEMPEGD
jgi:hypothetical protein